MDQFFIERITAAYARYCDAPSAVPISTASDASIEAARASSLALDRTYVHIVRTWTDGILADGVEIYPIASKLVTNRRGDQSYQWMGIVEANRHWRRTYTDASPLDDVVIYGRNDTSFFVFNQQCSQFEHRSRISIRSAHLVCASFEECLYEALKYALELADPDDSE